MATRPVIAALRRKYALALGREDSDTLGHLAAVILMFDPAHELDAIRPIRPRKHRERWLSTVLSVLRTANCPLKGSEITARVMALHGISYTDHQRRNSIAAGLQVTLGRLAERGIVKVEGSPRRWSV